MSEEKGNEWKWKEEMERRGQLEGTKLERKIIGWKRPGC